MSLGERITIEREKRNWSIAELARRARVDLKTLYAIEFRKSKRSEFAPQIAQALGLTTDDLLDDSKPLETVVRSPVGEYRASEFDKETTEFARAFQALDGIERRKWMAQVLLQGEEVHEPQKPEN